MDPQCIRRGLMRDSSCPGSSRRRVPRRLPRSGALCGAALVVSLSASARPASAAGTWEKAPSSASNGGPAFGLWLLTDGKVVSNGNALNHWGVLHPDSHETE